MPSFLSAWFILFVVKISLTTASPSCAELLHSLVNAFIGSGGPAYGYGSLNPAAQLPYSAMRLGPDTTTAAADISFRHFSGYNYHDDVIRGFSHTHLVGAGVNDLGNFGIMPFTLASEELMSEMWRNCGDAGQSSSKLPACVILPSAAEDGNQHWPFWWSLFDKETEVASPGRYAVRLTGGNVDIDAEFVAIGGFAALHRYRFNAATANESSLLNRSGVVIDICHAAKLEMSVGDSPCVNASFTLHAASQFQSFSGRVFFNGGLSHGIWVYVYGALTATLANVKESEQEVFISKWDVCNAEDNCQHIDTWTEQSEDITIASDSGVLFGAASFTASAKGDEPMELQMGVEVGISFISEQLAYENLVGSRFESRSASNDVPLEEYITRTEQQWCETLSSFDVSLHPSSNSTADDDFLRMLYTANYHTHLSPTSYTESDGSYMGVDQIVHHAATERRSMYGDNVGAYDSTFFSDLSLWDTFRTQHPLLLLRDEEFAVGVLRSMSDITVQQNAFPRWILASNEASCMIAEHGAAAVVEAIDAGLGHLFDVPTIQAAFLQQSTEEVPINGRTDVQHYISEGYVSEEAADDATSRTLSYAYDDYLLAMLSKYVNDQDTFSSAMNRSRNYRNVWSSSDWLFCPKWSNGTMQCPDDPATSVWTWQVYREGNALHWMWFVPHDPVGLINLFPTLGDYEATLESFFADHVAYHDKYGSALPNPYYWAGNEHDFLAPWLFNFGGADCTRTQYWVRHLLLMHFSNTAHGLPGNDDYGAMSSWLLWASLGLYPQAGTSNFLLTSPSVREGTLRIQLYGEDVPAYLTVRTHLPQSKASFDDLVYVDKLLLNGVAYNSPIIDRSVLIDAARGGTASLDFYLTDKAQSSLCSHVEDK